MHYARVYDWLVANGLYRDILAAAVGVAVGHVTAWRPLRKIARDNAARQDRIADLLDADTPGGIAELRDLLEGRKDRDRRPGHKPPEPHQPHDPPGHSGPMPPHRG